MFLVRDVHAHAVDLHTIVGGNEQIPAPADHAGLDEIAVLRRDGDLHLRRGDLELARAKNVLRIQRGILTVLLLALAAEALTPLSDRMPPTSPTVSSSGAGSRLSLCS